VILTVTPNTALDVTYELDRLVPGAVLRPTAVHHRAGGKGVNVARVLYAVGRKTLALATAGGSDGSLVRRELAGSGVPHILVGTAGATRRTTTLLSTTDGTVTLVNEPGPRVSPAEWEALVEAVREALQSASVLVCSGSLPPGVPADAYATLIRMATAAGVPTVLDTSGDALAAGIAAGPAVAKPNAEELRDVTGLGDPLAAARSLRVRGAGAVIVSLGAEGMLACSGTGEWHAAPSRRLAGNTTGAGDAAVAGIAMELADGSAWPDVLRRAVALSSAAVLGPLAGDVDLAHYRREHPEVVVRGVPAEYATGEDANAFGSNE